MIFIGSKQIGLNVLSKVYELYPEQLQGVVTFDDSNDIRTKLDSFKTFSKTSMKPLYILSKPSDLVNVIEKVKPDLGIVAGWYWIIKPEILNKVQRGILGLHASLLPKYRGSAPLVWQIINGEKESGITLFYFDEGMDSGNIVGQKKFKIKENYTIMDVLNKANSLSIELIDTFLPLIINDTHQRNKQNHLKASYCSQRNPGDGHINWHLSNKEIHNFIRAQTDPYPGAFSYFNDKKLIILKSKIFESPYYGIPGLVTQVKSNNAVVTCGQGGLYIEKVIVEGTPVQKISNILKYGMKLC
jgi:methionyl-tRNA formyltransferase